MTACRSLWFLFKSGSKVQFTAMWKGDQKGYSRHCEKPCCVEYTEYTWNISSGVLNKVIDTSNGLNYVLEKQNIMKCVYTYTYMHTQIIFIWMQLDIKIPSLL